MVKNICVSPIILRPGPRSGRQLDSTVPRYPLRFICGQQLLRGVLSLFFQNPTVSGIRISLVIPKTSEDDMRRRKWFQVGSDAVGRPLRSLQNRIVVCADCETNQTLTVTSSGSLACSTCGSENWLYTSSPIVALFRQYEEKQAVERQAVDRYIRRLEQAELSPPAPTFFSS